MLDPRTLCAAIAVFVWVLSAVGVVLLMINAPERNNYDG